MGSRKSPAVGGVNNLPDDCLSRVISFTTPRDACVLCSVSRTFRSAASSDATWQQFLPPDYHSILSPADDFFFSKKNLYFRLCNESVLIDEGKMSFGLEKSSGAKCFMISARALSIDGGDEPLYWDWVINDNSRFIENAVLLETSMLKIQGKMDSKLLTPNTIYAAYLIFKLHNTWGLGMPLQKTNVILAGKVVSENLVCLNPDEGQINLYMLDEPLEITENAIVPKEREDGWMEIELGEFYNEGVNGLVEASLMEVRGGHSKNGLIVEGIEVRPKRSSSKTMPFSSLHDTSSAVAPDLGSSAYLDAYWVFNQLEGTEVLYCPFPNLHGPNTFRGVTNVSGHICFMIPARALTISWGDDRRYWKWTSRPDSRFSECAELINVCWLEIHGKVDMKLLTPSIAYVAFFIFKLKDAASGLVYPLQETNITISGTNMSQHSVCLHPRSLQPEMNVMVPRNRSDGWMEIEIGHFYCSDGVQGEVDMSLKETKSNRWKSGLIVQGIEVRPKH